MSCWIPVDGIVLASQVVQCHVHQSYWMQVCTAIDLLSKSPALSQSEHIGFTIPSADACCCSMFLFVLVQFTLSPVTVLKLLLLLQQLLLSQSNKAILYALNTVHCTTRA